MTAHIEILATQNLYTTGGSRRTWGAKAHPGYDPKLDAIQSTMNIKDEEKLASADPLYNWCRKAFPVRHRASGDTLSTMARILN